MRKVLQEVLSVLTNHHQPVSHKQVVQSLKYIDKVASKKPRTLECTACIKNAKNTNSLEPEVQWYLIR